MKIDFSNIEKETIVRLKPTTADLKALIGVKTVKECEECFGYARSTFNWWEKVGINEETLKKYVIEAIQYKEMVKKQN